MPFVIAGKLRESMVNHNPNANIVIMLLTKNAIALNFKKEIIDMKNEDDFNTFGITDSEEKEISSLVERIFNDVKARCAVNGCDESETSASVYTIQDFLGSIDTDPKAKF